MDFMQLLNEVKTSSDYEVQSIAASYGVDFSITEIQALRPLLDDIAIHWIFTGIPESFIQKVEQAIGSQKTNEFLKMYMDATKRF